MKKILLNIWTYWSFFATVLVFILVLPLNLFLVFFLGTFGRNIFVRYSRHIGNILIFLFGMKKEISGFYPFKHTKPCVYIANHKSYLDVIIIASLIPHKLKYLGKAEVFNWPLFGFFAKYSGQIPVKREDKDSRQQGYELMKKAIDDGFSIILFPEGGWKNNGDSNSANPYDLKEHTLLQKFRNGAFRLALEKETPIIPITLLNAQERFSDITMKVTPGKIKIHVFDLIDSKIFRESIDLNHKCYNLMLGKLKEYKT